MFHPGMIRRHVLILIVLTLLTRGAMFVSYPLGGGDDNQSAQRWLVDELLAGNLLVGNLRFNTGYAFVSAPVVGLAGRFDDQVLLAVQVGLSALIPFMLYDIIRQRRSAGEAFVVALVVMLDPFGWQWAHFTLPAWLVAWCIVLMLWLIQRGLVTGRVIRFALLAGLAGGVAALSRLNSVPVIALIGVACFGLWALPLRQRVLMFAAIGMVSGGLLLAYLLLIHLPSTGTLSLSCISGQNLLVSVYQKRVPIAPENGPITAEVFDLLTLPALTEITFFSDSYSRWQQPGPWATEAEREAFFSQPYGQRAAEIRSVFPPEMYYYFGPCATDDLLRGVHHEAVAAHPLAWLRGVADDVANMLVQRPNLGGPFDTLYLPRASQLTFAPGSTLGFTRAEGDYYNGQIVWHPGIELLSALFDTWNLFKWLTPLALLWALRSRDWLYTTAALLLCGLLLSIAISARPEPRYYAILYPLYPLLIGGLLYAGGQLIGALAGRNAGSR